MDYEEIPDAQGLRMPSSGTYVVSHLESKTPGDAGAGTTDGAGSLVVRDAGGLAASATVDPALYSKVIRRCLVLALASLTFSLPHLTPLMYCLASVCWASYPFTFVSPGKNSYKV